MDRTVQDIYAKVAEEDQILHQRLENQNSAHDLLNSQHSETGESLRRSLDKLDATKKLLEQQLGDSERALRQELADKAKESNERVDQVERHHANTAKEARQRLNTMELRMSGLQGSCGEHKRDIGKMREEVNALMVKTGAHDVDLGKLADDVKKIERTRVDDAQRHKQDMDAVYEELDQKVYEK